MIFKEKEEDNLNITKTRVAISSFFFIMGLCFATWGSRIPTIQHELNLSEAKLGTILFAVPVGMIISMLVSSFFVEKFGSKRVLITGMGLYSFMLLTLGFANSVLSLVFFLLFYGFTSNLADVSVNTQAIGLENIYKKSIMASFHGIWSLAGFIGAFIGSIMISLNIQPKIHFIIMFILSIFFIIFNGKYLISDKPTQQNNTSVFSFPDKALLGLGFITFSSMICEGTMFDWSGVYFNKVINVKPELTGLGYTAFMSTMAGTRFLTDQLVDKLGLKFILMVSGILITTGLFISIVIPNIITGVIGFLLVGIGTASVVPMTLSLAGKVSSGSTSRAVTSVSTIGFLGFLIGPPLIGWVAGLSSLRISFGIIALMGLFITVYARKIK